MEQEKQHSALLVMDMQASILQRLPDSATIINKVSQAISSSRQNKIPVIYVVVGFRNGAPEMSMNNKGLSASTCQGGSGNDWQACDGSSR